jgi:hypothetical protein
VAFRCILALSRLATVMSTAPGTSSKHLPYARAWNIAARTVHLGATSILVGGIYCGEPLDALTGFLALSAVTGLALVAIEGYSNVHWVDQLWFLAVLTKLLLLSLLPLAAALRVPVLFVAIAIASIGSHAPHRIRHYSMLLRREMHRGD